MNGCGGIKEGKGKEWMIERMRELTVTERSMNAGPRPEAVNRDH